MDRNQPQDTVPSGRRHMVGLDGLRGIAALVVVASHAIDVNRGGGKTHQFFLAVDFFFVLSGYVIAHAYERRLRDRTLGFWKFLGLRIVRLHPMLLAGIAITLAFLIQHHVRGYLGPTPDQMSVASVTGVLLIPWHSIPIADGMTFAPMFPLDGPAWSLFVEYALNLAFALLVAHLDTRALLTIVAIGALGLFGLVWRYGTMSVGFELGQGGVALIRGIYPFFVGVLISRLERTGRLPRLGIPWWMSAIVLSAFLLAPIGTPAPWFELPVIFVVWPTVIISARTDRLGHHGQRALEWAGAISYPVYILHVPILLSLAGQFYLWPTPWRLAVVASEVVLTVLISQIVLIWYDAPVRNWLERRLRKPQPTGI